MHLKSKRERTKGEPDYAMAFLSTPISRLTEPIFDVTQHMLTANILVASANRQMTYQLAPRTSLKSREDRAANMILLTISF